MTFEQISAFVYRLGLARDNIEFGDALAGRLSGRMKYLRSNGSSFTLSYPGVHSGLASVSIQDRKITIPYAGVTVELSSRAEDVDAPDGRAEFNVILNSKPTPDINGEYWQTLNFDSTGLNFERILGLDEEYSQAQCYENWYQDLYDNHAGNLLFGHDNGTGIFVRTATEIRTPDGLFLVKSRPEHLVHSVKGQAIQNNHWRSVIGKNKNNGQDMAYNRVTRDHLELPRRMLVDARGNTARIEDVQLVGNQLRFKLPKAFIERGSTKYPVQHATGLDPAYTQDMDSFQSNGYGGSDGVWGNYDLYTNKGVPKGAVAEFILSNATTGTENRLGLRTDGSALARYVDIHEAEGGGQTHCRMFVVCHATTGLIEPYHSDVSDADYFYLVGYWENVTFTESVDSFTASGASSWLTDDFSTIGETASYGNYIYALWGDATHIYAGGYTTNTVRKYLKSDLSYIGETASYGGSIYALWGDDTHIYAAGLTTNTVRKYLKSDLSYIGETASYGNYIFALWGDNTHIYAAGLTTNTVRKYLKSDLSYIGQTASYGGSIYALYGDDTHVYAAGEATNTVRKYLKSDLSYIGETASYGGIIRSLWGDNTHIYAAGSTTYTVRKYLKSDLSYIGETASYGGDIYALWGDNTHIYAAGLTTNTVRKYLPHPDGLYHILLNNAEQDVANTMGARASGSALERKIVVHEPETGGSNLLDLFVKGGGIGLYTTDITNTSFTRLGSFGTELDFVELWQAIPLTTTSWEAEDLTAYLDQDGRMVDFLLTHEAAVTAGVTLGVRGGDDAATERKLVEHEAEWTGADTHEYTGFSMSAQTNASGVVNLIASNAEEAMYLTGYFKATAIPGVLGPQMGFINFQDPGIM